MRKLCAFVCSRSIQLQKTYMLTKKNFPNIPTKQCSSRKRETDTVHITPRTAKFSCRELFLKTKNNSRFR